MRLGELIALRANDIDFEEGFIRVDESISLRDLGTPKNGCSRLVHMSRQLTQVLANYLLEIEKLRIKNRWKKAPEWLFFNRSGDFIDPDDYRERVYKEIFRKENERRQAEGKPPLRRITLHQLRHTFASSLIKRREHLDYIMKQMGHSSIQVTIDLYGHLLPLDNREAADKLDDPDLDLHLPAPQLHPEAVFHKKEGQENSPNPSVLFGCGGKI